MKIVLPSYLKETIENHGDNKPMEPNLKPITTPLIATPGATPMEGQLQFGDFLYRDSCITIERLASHYPENISKRAVYGYEIGDMPQDAIENKDKE